MHPWLSNNGTAVMEYYLEELTSDEEMVLTAIERAADRSNKNLKSQ
jgi:hypothetical protein